MRLPEQAHTAQTWRIHRIAPDFRLEDVWALPATGGADEFPRLVEGFAAAATSESPSLLTRALFALRWKLGALFGWDAPETGAGAGPGSRVATLRDRLPADLRDGTTGPRFSALPFTPLYLTTDEFAAEIANQTMHGILHLGWVPDPTVPGGHRGQMAVLVKPNRLLGQAYMLAIRPFRYTIVYPTLMRQINHQWHARPPERVPNWD